MPHEWIEIKDRRWCVRCHAMQIRFAWGTGQWRPSTLDMSCARVFKTTELTQSDEIKLHNMSKKEAR